MSVADGRVRFGPALARLAVAAHLNVAQQIRPYLERLCARPRRDGGAVGGAWRPGQPLDQIVSRHELRVVTSLGVTLPMSCTATGKASLAQLPDDVVAATLGERLEKRTANRRITMLDALLGQLAEAQFAAGLRLRRARRHWSAPSPPRCRSAPSSVTRSPYRFRRAVSGRPRTPCAWPRCAAARPWTTAKA